MSSPAGLDAPPLAQRSLPDREVFMQRLEAALKLIDRQRGGFAVLLVEPPEAGPSLRQVLDAIQASVRHSDTVAALNQREFAILLAMGNEGGAQRVASKIAASLATPGHEASIGIALAPTHGQTPEQLLRAADGALYQARRNRRGIVMAVADDTQHETAPLSASAPESGVSIGSALELDQLVLRFQPVVELATSRLLSAESLVRWLHPTLGLLPPGEFLHLLERDARADAISLQLIEKALLQLREWRNHGLVLPVSVNLGVQTLALDALEDAVLGRLHALSLPPEHFCIELRDVDLTHLPAPALKNLYTFAAAGVQFTLDDFGAGAASFAALRDLPFNEIKLAAQFVTPLCRSAGDEAIVGAILQLGRSLGRRVVAKGVEDAETRQRLVSMGCSYAQGFVFAQAMDPEVLAGWQIAMAPSLG